MFYEVLPMVILLLSGVLGFQVHGVWHSRGEREALLTEEC